METEQGRPGQILSYFPVYWVRYICYGERLC